MKRKIAVTSVQRTIIVAALIGYGAHTLAFDFNREFEAADPANDGPEVAILSVDRDLSE